MPLHTFSKAVERAAEFGKVSPYTSYLLALNFNSLPTEKMRITCLRTLLGDHPEHAENVKQVSVVDIHARFVEVPLSRLVVNLADDDDFL